MYYTRDLFVKKGPLGQRREKKEMSDEQAAAAAAGGSSELNSQLTLISSSHRI
jgi:hypothetical protein